jgi:hypothetical protein
VGKQKRQQGEEVENFFLKIIFIIKSYKLE